jgi:phage terminase small subunit
MTNENHIPKYLKRRGRAFYKSVREEFILDKTHDLERLGLAGGELDIQDGAQAEIDKHGFYVKNRYGKLIENPAVKTLRESRTLFIKIVREMGLDLVTAEQARLPGKY